MNYNNKTYKLPSYIIYLKKIKKKIIINKEEFTS